MTPPIGARTQATANLVPPFTERDTKKKTMIIACNRRSQRLQPPSPTGNLS